jgi:hypothetical protein
MGFPTPPGTSDEKYFVHRGGRQWMWGRSKIELVSDGGHHLGRFLAETNEFDVFRVILMMIFQDKLNFLSKI